MGRPRVWNRHTVLVPEHTLRDSAERAAEQTAAYGHDSGYFRLGRSDSSHEIGCRGELISAQFIEPLLPEGATVHLNEIGSVTDVSIQAPFGSAGLHVKTGLYRSQPDLRQPFGVHFAQRLHMTGKGLILISLMRDRPEQAIVEGIIFAEELGSFPVIRKGERFPGRTYTSRTDNRLTYISDYKPITASEVHRLLRDS